MTLELPFSYHSLYKPLFLTLWSSFASFSFGESERSLGVRVLLEIFKRREDLAWVFQDFPFHLSFFEWENFSKYENSNFSLVFSTQSIISINFKTFSFIEFHETHSFTSDYKDIFSSISREIHLRIEWNMFLHDPTWKYHHMKPCSFFQFFGRIFTARTWFWLFSLFVKFVSLSTFSTLIHMRRGNKV